MSTPIETRVDLEGGKYTIVCGEGRLQVLRHSEPWLDGPEGSKAWIAAAGEIEALRAAKPPGVGWRPIAEAPESGVFLVYMPEERECARIHTAQWHPNVKVIGGVFHFDRKPVTHFMPLPDEPGGLT